MEKARDRRIERRSEMFWRIFWPLAVVVIFGGAVLFANGCGGGGGGTKADNSSQNDNLPNNPPPADDNTTTPPPDSTNPPPADDNTTTPPPDSTNPPPADDNTTTPPPDNTNPPPADDNTSPPPDNTTMPAPKWWVSPPLKYAFGHTVAGVYLQKENDTLWVGICGNKTTKQVVLYSRSIKDRSMVVGFKDRAALSLDGQCNDSGIIVHDDTLYVIVNEVKYYAKTPWIAEKSTWKIYSWNVESGGRYAFSLKYAAEFSGMVPGTLRKGMVEFVNLNGDLYAAINLKKRVEVVRLDPSSKTFAVNSVFDAPVGFEIAAVHLVGRNDKLSMGVVIEKPNAANASNTDFEHNIFLWSPESESFPAGKTISAGTECCSLYATRLLHSRHLVLPEMVNLSYWLTGVYQYSIKFAIDDPDLDFVKMGYHPEAAPKGTGDISIINGDKVLFAVWRTDFYGDSLGVRRIDRLEEGAVINAPPTTRREANPIQFYPVTFSDESPVIVWDVYPSNNVVRFAVGTY